MTDQPDGISDLPIEEADEKLDLLSLLHLYMLYLYSVDSDTELNQSEKKAKKQTVKKSAAGQKKK